MEENFIGRNVIGILSSVGYFFEVRDVIVIVVLKGWGFFLVVFNSFYVDVK